MHLIQSFHDELRLLGHNLNASKWMKHLKKPFAQMTILWRCIVEGNVEAEAWKLFQVLGNFSICNVGEERHHHLFEQW